MKLNDSGGSFEEAPTGTHPAICVQVIDLGTQKNNYQGSEKIVHKCMISWETPNAKMTGEGRAGTPFVVTKFYTASLNEKANLRQDLRNWRGRDFTELELKGFESRSILGKPCFLSITPDEKGKSKITGVMKLPQGTQLPPPHHKPVYFSLEKAEFSLDVYNGLSDGIKNIINKSPEFALCTRTGAPAAVAQQSTAGPQFPDDDPFDQVPGPDHSTFDQLDDDIPF